jgi:hypothetical protein
VELISNQEQKYILGSKSVAKIGEFYKDLILYISGNIFLSTIIIVGDINDGGTFAEAFLKFKTFAVWIF